MAPTVPVPCSRPGDSESRLRLAAIHSTRAAGECRIPCVGVVRSSCMSAAPRLMRAPGPLITPSKAQVTLLLTDSEPRAPRLTLPGAHQGPDCYRPLV